MVAVPFFSLGAVTINDLQPGISFLLWQFAVDFRIAEKIIPAAVCLSQGYQEALLHSTIIKCSPCSHMK